MERSKIQAKLWEAYESGSLILACAWCARLCLEGEWFHPDRNTLKVIEAPLMLSHGICPSCAKANGVEPEARTKLAN